jgi:8-oxo-dGTP pyrophosphatase MutT (NUDIX family)
MGDITRHSVSVTAIVTRDDGRVLVMKRDDDGRWILPGGVLELAETPQQGCAREVLEETGYRVEVGPLTGVYKNMKLGVVSLAFRCALSSAASPATWAVRPWRMTSSPSSESTRNACWIVPGLSPRSRPSSETEGSPSPGTSAP